MRNPSDTPPQDDRHAQLERAFIAEYLLRHQRTPESIRELPPDKAEGLLKEAALYASGRLCEVESRAHLLAELHHGHKADEREPHVLAERDALAAIPEAPTPPPHADTSERSQSPPRRPLKWLL